jgi:hypothetical protein
MASTGQASTQVWGHEWGDELGSAFIRRWMDGSDDYVDQPCQGSDRALRRCREPGWFGIALGRESEMARD